MTQVDACLLAYKQSSSDVRSAEAILKDVEDEARLLAGDDDTKYPAALAKVLKERADEIKAGAYHAEQTMAAQLEARERAGLMVDEFRRLKKSALKAITAVVETAGNNAQGEAVGVIGKFQEFLSKDGLGKYLKDKQNRADILTELAELNKTANQKIGVTGKPEAIQIAKIFHDMHQGYRAMQQSFGVPLNNLEGWSLRNWFDSNILTDITPDRFVDDMIGRVDRERTFGDANTSDAKVRDYLKGYFDNIVGAKVRDVPINERETLWMRPTYKKKADRTRALHLKSVDDQLFVLDNYTNDSIPMIMGRTLAKSAYDATIMRDLGPNPANTLEHIIQTNKAGLTPKQAMALESPGTVEFAKMENPRAVLEKITGGLQAKTPRNEVIVNAIRGMENFVKAGLLQRAMLASIGDLGTFNAASSRIGAGAFRGIGHQIESLFAGLDPESLRILANSADAMNSYTMGELQDLAHGNLASSNGFYRASQKAIDFTMKYGFMNWWTKTMKGAAGQLVASYVPQVRNVAFDDLSKGLRFAMLRGGVDKTDWGVLSKNMDALVNKQTRHQLLDPDLVRELPDSVFIDAYLGGDKNASRQEIARAKERLSGAVSGMYRNFTNDAIPNPGVKEQTFLNMQAVEGDPLWMFSTFMRNLMGYPVSYISRVLARELEIGGSRAASGIFMLSAMGLFYGHVADVMRNASELKFYDYDDMDGEQTVAVVARAAAYGGLGGIFGSMMIDFLERGDGPLSSMPGVTPTLINDAFTAAWSGGGDILTEGDPDKLFESIIKSTRMIPGTQLPWAKYMYDNMVMFPLLEMVDPGAVNKIENNFNKKTGGQYIWEPGTVFGQ